MSDYEIGYGKPPKANQFKSGQSGNKAGRRKAASMPLKGLVQEIMNAPMPYRENGKRKTATRSEVAIKFLMQKAVDGDVDAAEQLLTMRSHAVQHGEKGIGCLLVTDWLPDFPGETGDQKMQNLAPPAGKPIQRNVNCDLGDKDGENNSNIKPSKDKEG